MPRTHNGEHGPDRFAAQRDRAADGHVSADRKAASPMGHCSPNARLRGSVEFVAVEWISQFLI